MIKFVMTTLMLSVIAAPVMAAPFSKEIVDTFVEGCSEDGAEYVKYCQCTIDELQGKLTEEEFMELINLPGDDATENEHFDAAITSCAEHIPEG